MAERGKQRDDEQGEAGPVEHLSADAPRRGEWLLLMGIILIAGIAGFYTPRLFWRSDRRPPGSAQLPGETQPQPADPGHQKEQLPPPETETAPSGPAASGSETASAGPVAEEDPPPPQSVAELIGEAEQVVDHLTETFPNNPDALEMMARVQVHLAKSAEAVAAWQKCLELDPAYAYAYFGMGSLALKEENYERAVDLLRKGLALAPGGYRPVFDLAGALMKLGRLEGAIAVLERHIQTDPQAAWSHFLLGQIHLQLRQYEQAKQAYELALKIHDDQTGDRSAQAAVYSRQGQTEQFREYMEELNRLRTSALYGLATAYGRLGEKEKAREYMEEFTKLRAVEKEVHSDTRRKYDDLRTMSRDFAVTFTHIGRIYYAHGDLPEAEKLWRRAATLDREHTESRAQLVSLYRRADRTEEALQICEQLTRIEPENAVGYLNLGSLHAQAGRFLAAEEAFEKAAEVAPERCWGYRELAQLYLAHHTKLPEAKRLAQEAVRLEPVAENYFLLSEACDRNGDSAGAVAAIQRAVELQPGNTAYQRIQDLLRARN